MKRVLAGQGPESGQRINNFQADRTAGFASCHAAPPHQGNAAHLLWREALARTVQPRRLDAPGMVSEACQKVPGVA